jgi:hypothetical protein
VQLFSFILFSLHAQEN